VIRRDGSVDSIQLVRGVDDQLDAIAMQALSQLGSSAPPPKQGAPIELEAIVHIPFHAPSTANPLIFPTSPLLPCHPQFFIAAEVM